jgi:hypothetical protein
MLRREVDVRKEFQSLKLDEDDERSRDWPRSLEEQKGEVAIGGL